MEKSRTNKFYSPDRSRRSHFDRIVLLLPDNIQIVRGSATLATADLLCLTGLDSTKLPNPNQSNSRSVLQ